MEERKLKVLFGKSGNGYLTPRITLPISWLNEMGISKDNREVKVVYDKEKQEIKISK